VLWHGQLCVAYKLLSRYRKIITMDREWVLAKVRKCLALSTSSNEHEAAAALRQAKRLLEKYGLSTRDADFFALRNHQVETEHRRKPKWVTDLGFTVATAFGCSVFSGYGRLIFVGEDAAAEIAGYSFDVLYRKLTCAKANYLTEIRPQLELGRGQVAKLGRAFCEGWVIGVDQVVEAFAKPLSTEQHRRHSEFLSQAVQTPIKMGKERRSAVEQTTFAAARAGFVRGREEELHAGVGAGHRPVNLSGR